MVEKDNITNVSEDYEEYIGDKIMLNGGGGVANEFYVGILEDINSEENRIKVRLNDSCPSSGKTFTPILGSWKFSIIGNNSFSEVVPIGQYTMVISPVDYAVRILLDSSSIGMFGTIYDGNPVAYVDEKGKWHKAGDDLKEDYGR